VLGEPTGLERALSLLQIGVRSREQTTQIRVALVIAHEQRHDGQLRRRLFALWRSPRTAPLDTRGDAELSAHDHPLPELLSRGVRAHRTIEPVTIAKRDGF